MKTQPQICVSLGRRLRTLRQEKGFTQEKLALLAGMNWRYYAEVERGQRNISVASLQRIADALGVTIEDIFRFPSHKRLLEDEEKIIALVTRLLAKGDRKAKHKVAVILQELV